MKNSLRHIFSFIFFFLFYFNLFSQNNTVLYDQTGNAGKWACFSQSFPDIGYDLESADDFTVPADEIWYVDSFLFVGLLTGGANFHSVDISIFNDSNNLPGTLFYKLDNFVTQVPADGNFKISLPEHTVLPEGRYWISFLVNMDFFGKDTSLWLWKETKDQSGNPRVFRDSKNLFGSGIYQSWHYVQNGDSTLGFDPDLLFAIYGTLYHPKITVSQSISFGNINDIKNYKIIGIPGNASIPVNLSGEYQYNWRVCWDNGQDQNYLEEKTDYTFSPGKAYWILSKDPLNFSQEVNSVTLDNGNDSYSIPLHQGWNLISTPFERSTKWESIKTINGLAANQLLYAWNNGSYSNQDAMLPYHGYYFNNNGGLISLKIPYDPSGTLGKISAVSEYPIDVKKFLKISLSNINKGTTSEIFVGINPGAKEGYDENDYYSAPADFQETRINLIKNELPIRNRYFFIEQRPAIKDGQKYDLEIKTVPNESLELRTEGIENFDQYNIYLLDLRLNNLYNLKKNKNIQLNLAHQYNPYELYIGSENFIKSLKQNIQPFVYYLFQNYPNPFNPKTTLRFSIPENTKVSLKVFDILGKTISTLIDDEYYNAGNYEVEFDGKDLPSGIYIVGMHTQKFTDQKKIVLLK